MFWETALLFPLLEEIMLVRRDEVQLNEQKPVHMVAATNASSVAFEDAVKAFTEANTEEMGRREGTLFFSGVRTENEAIQRILEAPREPGRA